MIWLFVGLAIGIQIGYWANTVQLWSQEMLAYLGAIKKQRKGIPLPKLIAPDGTTQSQQGPSIVKPKTPRQLRVEQVRKIRERGL